MFKEKWFTAKLYESYVYPLTCLWAYIDKQVLLIMVFLLANAVYCKATTRGFLNLWQSPICKQAVPH